MTQSNNDFHRSSYHVQLDESALLNRFGGSFPVEENQNHFLKYVAGNKTENRQSAPHQNIQLKSRDQSVKRYPTETSQMMSFDAGFKKMKFNQVQALKQLKQEYEILRNLPIDDQPLENTHVKRNTTSVYSSQSENISQISSSKQSRVSKKKSEISKDAHLLSLEKKQLELVIGNSMRKIEELLTNETVYKKTIHELQLQLDSKNSDNKVEELTKTIKKNEIEYIELNETNKKEYERLKDSVNELRKRNEKLQSELLTKGKELRESHDQIRRVDERNRIERDKYFNLEIEFKRLKMESELMEKEKNNEIHRLNSVVENAQGKENSPLIKRLEEELHQKQRKYQNVVEEFQNFKRTASEKPKPVIVENDDHQIRLMQKMIGMLKEESSEQNKMSMNLLQSIVAKIEERREEAEIDPAQEESQQILMNEIQRLRNQMNRIKEKREQQPILLPNTDFSQYMNKINELQQEIEDGSVSKQKILEEYRVIKSSYEYTKEQYDRLNEEYQNLRQRFRRSQQEGNNSYEELRGRLRERENEYEENIKQLRRKNDQLEFLVQKTNEQSSFNLNLMKAEQQAEINSIRGDLVQAQNELKFYKNQTQKIKLFYEDKIRQKNQILSDYENSQLKLKEEYERELLLYKNNHEREINTLAAKIEGTAEVNDRYVRLSNKCSHLEREVYELRALSRKMKGMNEGIDHLWQIKEAEYSNINESLRHLRAN